MLVLKQTAQLLGWWTVLLVFEGVNMCKLASATPVLTPSQDQLCNGSLNLAITTH